MQWSNIGKWIGFLAIAIFVGYLLGRQRQLFDGQRELQRQIDELKKPSEPLDIDLKIDNAAVKGNPNARVTMIEFSDFECPYCGRYFRESYLQVERDYIATGKVRYVFRHFPLTDLHPHAMKAGEAAECARRQDKFWPLHDRLFGNQRLLDPASLTEHARQVGLDMKGFTACLDGQAEPAVSADLDSGTRAGISATPTFFFGLTGKEGAIHVVDKIVGARPYAAIQAVLDKMLEVK